TTAGDGTSASLAVGNTAGSMLNWSVTESVADLQPSSSYLTSNPYTDVSGGLATLGRALLASGSVAMDASVALQANQISQMMDNTPGDEGVACVNQDSGTQQTFDNSWWRRFYFSEHPVVGATANVTEVAISTGSNVVSGGLPATVNLYTIPHATAADTIPTASLTLIGTADVVLTGALQTIQVPVSGLVDDTVAKDLVVEIHTDGNASGEGAFFPGAN